MTRGPVSDARLGHDSNQLGGGLEVGKGGVGGGNLQDVHLPRPQGEDTHGGEVRDPTRRGRRPLARRHRHQVGTNGDQHASGKATGINRPRC